MNKLGKIALTIPAVLAVIGGVALTQVAAQSGTTGSAATPQATVQPQQGQRGQRAPGAQSAQTGQVDPNQQGRGGPGGPGGRGGRGGPGGMGGAVTAVSDTSVNITDQRQMAVTATLSNNTTVIQFTTQVTGTLSDIKVGENIQINGQPTGQGTLDAQRVIILPAGERAGGHVNAVDGATIKVDAHRDVITITTSSATQFYVNGKLGTIADVTVDKFVDAFGTKQTDGTLTATTIVVNDQPAGPQGGPDGRGPGRGGPQNQGQGCPPANNTTAPNTQPAPNSTVQ